MGSWVLAWTLSLAFGSDVTLSWARHQALQPPEAPPEAEAPGPRADTRALELLPRDDGTVGVVARWRLDAPRAGWFAVRLAGPMVTVDALTWRGREAAAVASPQGASVVLWVDGPGELVLRGTVVGDPARGPVALELLPAARGDARLDRAWGLEGEGVAWTARGRWAATAAALSVVEVPEVRRTASTLASASVGLGVTVGEAEVAVQARLVWSVARGALPEVRFRAPAGADLEVEGPLVTGWTRQGSDVVVALREPDAARIEVHARWTVPTPQGEQATWEVPRVEALGAYRTSWSLQVARDGEIEVVPRADGWEARADATLPPWGRGLVAGAPTAAYTTPRAGGAQLSLYRFAPVPQPPTLIDVQQITAALSDEGRVLMRVHYDVRNERGAFLRVAPPEGLRILGAVVAGETAEPAADGEAWLLPLRKSVETVQGLLSFPVQLVLVGELPAWERKETRRLGLPAVDAEVALSQVTVHLPPGYAPRHDEGEHGTVDRFAEGTGIAYGFSVGDARAAEADRLFQEAVSSWMSNDFDQAQQALDALGGLGAANENVARLQSNLDLLDGKGGGGSVALERRVKEQAKARSVEEAREQAQLLESADTAMLSGDYEQAEAAYGQALAIGDKLGKLDQDEDLRNAYKNLEVKKKLEATQELKAKRKKVATGAEEASRHAAPAEEAERRRQEEARARAEAEAAYRAAAQAESVRVEAQRLVISGSTGESTGMDGAFGGFDRGEHLPPPVPLDASTFARDDDERFLEGVVGGVEGGVVGGVVGGVLGGAMGAAAPEPSPEATVNTRSTSESIVVESRGRGGVRLPSFGGKKAATQPMAPPPPPPAPPPVQASPRPMPRPAPAPAPMAAPAEDAPVLTEEFLEKIPVGRSYQSAVQAAPGIASGKGSRKERKALEEEEEEEVVLDFDDISIEGDLTKPEGAYLAERSSERGGRQRKEADRAKAQARSDLDRPRITIRLGGDDELPDVKATSLDVIVPAQGDAVRFQRHLVPADADQGVVLEARRSRRTR